MPPRINTQKSITNSCINCKESCEGDWVDLANKKTAKSAAKVLWIKCSGCNIMSHGKYMAPEIPEAMIKYLAAADYNYLCPSCTESAVHMFKEFSTMKDTIKSLTDRLAAIELKNADENQAQNNISDEYVAKIVDLGERVQKLESRPYFNANAASWPKPGEVTEHTSHETYHKSELTQMLEENKRASSLVISGLPESDGNTAKDRQISDQRVVADIFDELDVNTSVVECYRIGQKTGEKPRLLKVQVSNVHSKRQILNASQQLKDSTKFSHIYLQPAMTAAEREEAFKLRQEVRRRREENEDVVIFNKKVVTREEKYAMLAENAKKTTRTFTRSDRTSNPNGL
jgi:hypothetical protein